jgi:CheY-like chemotaxis protein
LETELTALRQPAAGSDPILQAIGVESLHTRVLDAVGDGVAILDRDFKILYQNRVHRQGMGAHAGEYCHAAFHDRDRICDDCPAALTFEDGEIRTHGGHLTATSPPGRGSVFTSMLPATDQGPGAEDRNQKPVTGSGRILVMDDEEHVRKVAARMLARLGYETETATDGRNAVEAYRQAMAAGRPFAAVLMDLTIPGGMGGREAIKELLALDPQVKAIVSSGYANDPVMANHLRFGFTGVIPKPYDLAELGAMLRAVLS